MLYAIRTRDGNVLHQVQTGGAIAGGIITYRIGGRQYVAVSSGNISRSSWPGVAGIPSVVIYAIPGSEGALADPATLVPDLTRGRRVYMTSCVACHGAAGVGGEAPRMAGTSEKYTQAGMIAFILNPGVGMPRLHPHPLSSQDVAAVAAYTRSLAP